MKLTPTEMRNLSEQESRPMMLKLLFALLGTGYLMLFAWTGLALALGVFSLHLLSLMNIVRKQFP